MKLATSNIAWNDNHDCYYQQMVVNGFSGLEIAPTKFSANPYDNLPLAKQIQEEILRKYNLPIISIQSLLFGTEGLALFTDETSREALKKYLKKAILYAETICCPVLVFGNPKNRIMRDKTTDYAIAIAFFKELGNYANEHNTCLCIEPNPKIYGTNFINTLSEANQLVNEVQSAGFKMIVDVGTMLINQDAPEAALPALANTRHIHLSTPFLKPFNQEFNKHKTWFKKFMLTINQAKYDKFISLEMANASQEDIISSLKLLRLISP